MLASSIEESGYDGCHVLMPAGSKTASPSTVPRQPGLSARGSNVFGCRFSLCLNLPFFCSDLATHYRAAGTIAGRRGFGKVDGFG